MNLGFHFSPLWDVSDLSFPQGSRKFEDLVQVHFTVSYRSDWKDSTHLWKAKWIYVQIHHLAPWMLHRSVCFSLAWISHKSTSNRKLKVGPGTAIHNSCCQVGRIGGKDLKGIFCISGKNWTDGSASHPQPYPTRTVSLLQTNILQHSRSMGCIHKCQPLKPRSAERQGFLSLSTTPHANFPPL